MSQRAKLPQSLHHNTLAMSATLPGWMVVPPPLCLCPRNQCPRAATAPPAPPTARPSTSAPRGRHATAGSASPTCPPTLKTPRCRCRYPRCIAPRWALAMRRTSTPTGVRSAPTSDSVVQSWSVSPCPVIGPRSSLCWPQPDLSGKTEERDSSDWRDERIWEACGHCATYTLCHWIQMLLVITK